MSIATVDHEAKNHCNFSTADTSRKFSQKNGKVTEADSIWPSEKNIRFLIKRKCPQWPTGLQIMGSLHLYSTLQFTIFRLESIFIRVIYLTTSPDVDVHTPFYRWPVDAPRKTALWPDQCLVLGPSVRASRSPPSPRSSYRLFCLRGWAGKRWSLLVSSLRWDWGGEEVVTSSSGDHWWATASSNMGYWFVFKISLVYCKTKWQAKGYVLKGKERGHHSWWAAP